MRTRLLVSVVAIGASATIATSAAGQEALSESDRFNIDLHQGALLGSTRVVGLSGAFVAVAEETVGIPFNTASVANRTYFSTERFDWDFAFDFLIPGLFQPHDFDFDNNGRSIVEGSADFYALAAGAQLQYKAFGAGLYIRGQSGGLHDSKVAYRAGIWQVQLAVGYGLFKHQLLFGAGVRVGIFQINQQDESANIVDQEAFGTEVGVLLRPLWLPLRLGASISVPVKAETKVSCLETDNCPAGFVLPSEAALPWEIRIGAAWQLLGERQLNTIPAYLATQPTVPATQPTSQPVSKRYRGGYYLLVTGEVVLDGPLENAIGIEGFLRQVREVSGESVSVSPRLGLEAEVLRRRLRLRGGSYWEPSRVSGGSGRIHGTFAFELRLFDFSLWGQRSLAIGSAVDVASRYSNLSLSLGFWH